jgi:hypothetical protein
LKRFRFVLSETAHLSFPIPFAQGGETILIYSGNGLFKSHASFPGHMHRERQVPVVQSFPETGHAPRTPYHTHTLDRFQSYTTTNPLSAPISFVYCRTAGSDGRIRKREAHLFLLGRDRETLVGREPSACLATSAQRRPCASPSGRLLPCDFAGNLDRISQRPAHAKCPENKNHEKHTTRGDIR